MCKRSTEFQILVRERCLMGMDWLLDGIASSRLGALCIRMFERLDKCFYHEGDDK